MAGSKFTTKEKENQDSGQWKSAIQRRMDWKMCIHSPSNKRKTHVLKMPGDYCCDEDFQFEMALCDET